MLDKLPREERLRLMRFICSFAWADLEIRPKERAFVHGLVQQLGLSADEAQQVEGWLQSPPASVDPARIPRAHRQIFLDTVRQMIAADGEISEEEQENLSLLEQLTV